MPDDVTLEFCILNVAANPHPTGIYVDLLKKAATKPVKYTGDNFATITKPIQGEKGFHQGWVVCWTEIDPSEPAINKATLLESTLEDLNIQIPANVGFNGRVFLYTLRERDHKLFVETKNEFGKRLAPRMVGKIFQKLFNADVQGKKAPSVEVTVIPEDDVLEKILAMSVLKKLIIHMVRPNPDDMNDLAEEVLAELNEMRAKAQDIILTAQPGKLGLDLSNRVIAQAHAAQLNGFVEGRGKEDGKAIKRSTHEYPKIVRRATEGARSFVSVALQVAKATIIRKRNNQNL